MEKLCMYCVKSFLSRDERLYCQEDGFEMGLDHEACSSFEEMENLEEIYAPEHKEE
jgi:hypothetical protein